MMAHFEARPVHWRRGFLTDGSLLDTKSGKGKGMRGGWDDGKNPRMSCFAYAANEEEKPIWGARQLAYRSSQAVHFERLPASRSLSLGSVNAGLLICGELMARVYGRGRSIDRVRYLTNRQDVVIDIAHSDVAVRGFVRWTTAIEDVASAGRGRRPVLVAQHLCADSLARRLPKYTDDGVAPRLVSAGTRHQRRTPVGQLTEKVPAAVVDVYDIGCIG